MQGGLAESQVFICKDCQKRPYFFRKAHSVCVYEGIIKECIHLLKYRSKLSLVKPLSKLMINFAYRFLEMQDIDLILPVPLYSAKQRQRQFNQAKVLARPLARTFSKALREGLLIKTRPGPAQVSLSRPERFKNVQGTFKVRNAKLLKNKNILLVDDVLTTAATANECARVLSVAGAKTIDVFVLARSR